MPQGHAAVRPFEPRLFMGGFPCQAR
jgi:hypothetical protein